MRLELAGFLQEKHTDLESILSKNPSNHYKTYKIPKKTIGFRLIAQPTSQIKQVQKTIISLLEEHLPIHHCAKAYKQGTSIVDNAKVHLDSEYLLKMDLLNFFNSITPDIFFNEFKKNSFSVNKLDKKILTDFLFWNRSKKRNRNLVLSVGAPSSPFISNFVMFKFDQKVASYCESLNVNYTRYADDLTFSTKERDLLFSVKNQVANMVFNEFSGKLRINETKTVFSSKAHNRHITGIILTNNNTISIGHKRKRYISSLVYRFNKSILSDSEVLYLKGILSFVNNVEPLFVIHLVEKYGASVVDAINKYKSGDDN